MNSQEYYLDKKDEKWRLKFKVDDYFEHPEYWSDEVVLANWAKELYEADYKGISCIDFYDILFDDEDIAEKVDNKEFVKGTYCPKILKLYPRKKEHWTSKDIEMVQKWTNEYEELNNEMIKEQTMYKEFQKTLDYLENHTVGYDAEGNFIGREMYYKELKALKQAEGQTMTKIYKLHQEIKKKGECPVPKGTHIDYVFAGKENLHDVVSHCTENDFLMMKPVSFAGGVREISDEYARFLHAIVIEIDDLRTENDNVGFRNLLHCWEGRKYEKLPKPTFIVCSGNGVHLYFVLEKPVPLFKNVKEQLSKMREYLVKKFWCDEITKSPVQMECLTQNFRMVGTYGKNHKSLVCAFETGEKYTLEELNTFVPEECKVRDIIYKRNGLSIKEAEEKFPEWYKKRIINNEPKGTWYLKTTRMYYWWKNKIIEGAKYGCRFYMLEELCAIAVKCQVKEEVLDKDLEEIFNILVNRTADNEEPFTREDVLAAKSTYIRRDYNAFARRADIIRRKYQPFGIEIPITRRNGRKRNKHLEVARAIRDINNENWRYPLHGRPEGVLNKQYKKRDEILKWRKEHPKGTKTECIRETGISKPTVLKWWNAAADDIKKNKKIKKKS